MPDDGEHPDDAVGGPPPPPPPPGMPGYGGLPPPGRPGYGGLPPPGAGHAGGPPWSGSTGQARWSAPGQLLPLHPMTVGDVLDGAFRGLRATFGQVALVVLLIVAPYELLSNLVLDRLVSPLFSDAFVPTSDEVLSFDGLGQLFGASAVIAVVGMLVSVIVGAAVVALVLRVDRGEEADVTAAVRTGLRCSGTTIAATLLLGMAGLAVAVVGSLLLALLVAIAGPLALLALVVIVPVGIGAFVLLFGVGTLVVPIAVAEERGPIATLGRALWVMRVRFWRLLGITMLVLLVVTVVTSALALPFYLLAAFAGPVGWVVESGGDILTSVVTIPVTAFAALLVYRDARIRFEGYDLEVRARGLGPVS